MRPEGLFARAITQSGAAAHTLSPREGRLAGGILAEELGVAPSREAVARVPPGTLVRVASDLVAELQTAPDPARWGRLALSLLPFAPTVDGTVVPRPPLEAMADGQGARVPLLTGTNRDEARLFLVAPGIIDRIDDAALHATAAAYGLTPEALTVYRERRPGSGPGDVLAAVITDWFYRIPAVRVAEARATGGRATTWVYRFDHPERGDNRGLGACHGAEVPFVFGTIDRADARPLIGDTPSQAVADTAHTAWVSFVKDGTPGWSPYTLDDRVTGLLTDEVNEVADPSRDERILWDGIR